MLYRWLLRLYPYDFRRQYQDELEADFEALRSETIQTGGRRALLRCYGQTAIDLLRSVPREWLRTPWIPVILAAGLIASVVFYYVVVRVYRAGSFAPATHPPESPELMLLMAAMVLIPIGVIVLVGIASRFRVIRPFDRRKRV
jgi:hypothetical protein